MPPDDFGNPETFFERHGEARRNPVLIRESLAVLRDPTCAASDLVAILEKEPGVSSRVLKAANSAFFGTPRSITSLKAAVVRLGNHNVARFALASALGGPGAGAGAPWASFWRHSTAVALLSRHIAAFLGAFTRQEEEELFTMGLLHDLGVMVEMASGRFGEVTAALGRGPMTLEEAEQAVFGFDHGRLGEVAAVRWNFPSDLSAAMALHARPAQAQGLERKAVLVHLADLVAHGFRFPPVEGCAPPATEESYLETAGLPVEQLVLFGEWLLGRKAEIDAAGEIMA
jgi:HD-like signal output (HDOD) protein